MTSMNKCHRCGTTSYKPVIKRDGKGAMTQSGMYQCTGCRLEFATTYEWRTGVSKNFFADGGELPRMVTPDSTSLMPIRV